MLITDAEILNMSLRRHLCTPVVKLLAVFLSIFSIESTPVVPVDAAYDTISQVVAKLQKQLPNPFMAISEDFHHTSLCHTLTF